MQRLQDMLPRTNSVRCAHQRREQLDHRGDAALGVPLRGVGLAVGDDLAVARLEHEVPVGEAPRADGKQGWPGLRLRGDLLGGPSGLAKYPYVRESRRIRAEFTIREQHVGLASRAKSEAPTETLLVRRAA